jgi:hypothetical protein
MEAQNAAIAEFIEELKYQLEASGKPLSKRVVFVSKSEPWARK